MLFKGHSILEGTTVSMGGTIRTLVKDHSDLTTRSQCSHTGLQKATRDEEDYKVIPQVEKGNIEGRKARGGYLKNLP